MPDREKYFNASCPVPLKPLELQRKNETRKVNLFVCFVSLSRFRRASMNGKTPQSRLEPLKLRLAVSNNWGCGQATTEYKAPPQMERDVVVPEEGK